MEVNFTLKVIKIWGAQAILAYCYACTCSFAYKIISSEFIPFIVRGFHVYFTVNTSVLPHFFFVLFRNSDRTLFPNFVAISQGNFEI